MNDVSFTITSNLVSALWQIRKTFGEILLWADAICSWATQPDAQFLISFVAINQRAHPERNLQVLLMRNIYSKAERVIDWLGPDENDGSQAIKAFKTLFRNA